MPLPACATLSWYQLSSSWFCSPLAIALDVGFLVESEIFVSYHQLLITHCASRYWSSLNILLFGSNFFCLRQFLFQNTYSTLFWWSPFLLSAFLWDQSISLYNLYVLLVKAPGLSWLIQATFSYRAKPMQWPFYTRTNLKFYFQHFL